MSCLLLIAASARCQTTNTPIVSGFVTRYVSSSDFDVNGRRIVLDGKATVLMEQPVTGGNEFMRPENLASELHLGLPVDIYGDADRKSHSIKAYEVRIRQRQSRDIAGTAVIEAASADPLTADKLLKADGYTIHITPATKVNFTDPLKSADDMQPNVVLKYQGAQQADGSVMAKEVTVYKNSISAAAKRLRDDWDYDPHAVPAESHQSRVSKGFRGIDPSMFPLHQDDAVQHRIDTIASKLIPAYISKLPVDSDTRINLRFYLVDAPGRRDAFALPSGIILVPVDVVERMQNDSQLATVIADKIAALIEQQCIPLPATNKQLALGLGFEAASWAIPFGGLAYDAVEIPAGVSQYKLFHRNQEQRDRVTLSLLHDAGYDLTEAPKAWWLLASRKAKDLANTKPPDTSLYMYEVLGSTWAPAMR